MRGADTSLPGAGNGFLGLFGGALDFEDEEPVSLSHVLLTGSGATGPLTTDAVELEVGSGGYPAEGIEAAAATFDSASEVAFQISGPGAVAGVDSSLLLAGGAVKLGGAALIVLVVPSSGSGSCPVLGARRTYTLVSTTGGLSGSFANAPTGGEIPIEYIGGCARQSALRLRIAYDESGATQTVTATVTAPAEEHNAPTEEHSALPEEHHSYGESPPIPENHPTPFESTIEPWIVVAAAESAARQLALSEAEKRAFEAADREARESATSTEMALIEPESGSVSLLATGITVQSAGTALVKLKCSGSERCSGRLALSAQTTSKAAGKQRHTRTATIGTAQFSIAAGRSASIKIELTAAARALLGAGHGRLDARLKILESAPAENESQTRSVRLLSQPKRGDAKR